MPRSCSCAMASPRSSWRGGSRARPRRRCPPPGCGRPSSSGRGWPAPQEAPALPIPDRPPTEIVHSPLRRTAQTAETIKRSMHDAGTTVAATRRRRASSRSGRARGRACTGRRSMPDTPPSWPPGAGSRSRPGRPAESHSPWSRHGFGPRWRRSWRVWRRDRRREHRTAPRSPAIATRPSISRGRSSSRHDGVFKVTLLTLFDIPLDRFWMWSMDLCGISVIELRAGRPVLRAHNLTAHLAGLLDERAQDELEERSRSGAL